MEPQNSELTELARELRATYEVRADQWWGGPGRRLREVGFVIELSGRHAHDAQCRPGCRRCQRTYRQLLQLATAALPPDDRASRYDIEPFDSAWHGSAGPDHAVVLRIHVLHRDDGTSEVEECQQRCRDEICAALRAAGVKSRAGYRVA